MAQVNYAEDIVPLSSFRADVTRLMTQTRQTHRPIVVTQNGKAANVFLDVNDYQKLIDKVDLMMDIYKGEQDIAAGRVHSTDDVRRDIASFTALTGRTVSSSRSGGRPCFSTKMFSKT